MNNGLFIFWRIFIKCAKYFGNVPHRISSIPVIQSSSVHQGFILSVPCLRKVGHTAQKSWFYMFRHAEYLDRYFQLDFSNRRACLITEIICSVKVYSY